MHTHVFILSSLFISLFLLLAGTLLPQKALAAESFSAQYFNSLDLSGAPVLERTEDTPNHDFGSGSPDASVTTDNFSARWTGNVSFAAGKYRFLVTADDGVRLYIDGQLKIDRWVHQAATTYAAVLDLSEGTHTVVMEFYDAGGAAVAKLSWSEVTTSNGKLIMPIGDSLTHGYSVDGAYRTKLYELIPGIDFLGTQSSGPSSLADHDHEGHPGFRIDEIQSQIQNWLTQYQPDSILLLIGTNDILQSFQLDSAPNRLGNVVDSIVALAPTAKVYVGTIPPIANETQNQKAQSYNQSITTLINQKKQTNPNLSIVDIYGSVTTADMPDGVHPNQVGYDKMAQAWAAALGAQGGPSTPTPTPTATPVVTPTPTPPPGDGYTAHYFNNMNLSGPPVLTRNEVSVGADWGSSSPDPIVNVDSFSARWTKTISFSQGTYRFTVRADDGVRLKIDGNVIIDKWIDQPPTTYTVDVPLTEGTHEVVAEYYENAWGAIMSMSFEQIPTVTPSPTPTATPTPTPTANGAFTAQYYANRTLEGTPTLTRAETGINYDWGAGSPDPSIPIDDFSARWTSITTFAQGTYKFTVQADDGVRLFIDNQLVIDKWIDQAPSLYTYETTLEAGDHTIVLEYYEKGGGAVASLSHEPIEQVSVGSAFLGEYFANMNVSGIPAFTRIDDTIQFEWGSQAPVVQLPADGFSVRWSQNPTFAQGTYRFTVTGDDGVRLKIDNEVVLERWVDQAPTTYTVDVPLTAGQHAVVLEYYENAWGAVAKLSMEKISDELPPVVTSEFTSQFFNNLTLSGSPVLTRTDSKIDFAWGSASPDPIVPADNFSARFTTTTPSVEAGLYEFTMTVDDGFRLKIDGETVLNYWIHQPTTTYQIQKSLTAGVHTIVIEYYDAGAHATAIFDWKKL